MFRMIIHWVLSALALMVVSRLVQGFYVNTFEAGMIAALVIGFLNSTLGFLLKMITFPLAIVTFGLFLVVINAGMILMASSLVSGFYVAGWTPALWGAAVLTIIGLLVRFISKE